MRYELVYSCISHIGNVRSINQDNFVCENTYAKTLSDNIQFPISGKIVANSTKRFGVFDGMGGEECGEIASLIAAEEFAKMPMRKDGILLLNEYCKIANKHICEYAENNGVFSMGTTVAILLFEKKTITLCNIGDSKIFRLSDGELTQISQDHIVMSAFWKKPPLSQNLGIPPEQLIIEPYLSQGEYKKGDKYLICSDGITDMLTCEEIEYIIANNNVNGATKKLLEKALSNGGRDNITFILLEIKQSRNKIINFFINKRRMKNYEM